MAEGTVISELCSCSGKAFQQIIWRPCAAVYLLSCKQQDCKRIQEGNELDEAD